MRRRQFLTGAAGAALVAAGCTSADPLGGGAASGASAAVKVGSAHFPESEIVAEIYAQSLEAAGFTIERRMQIGARDVYLAALKDGSIDLIPEYGGNLLQYFDPSSTAKSSEEIAAALKKAVPEWLVALTPSAAENKDAYHVTPEFSARHQVTSLADLVKVGPIRLGGNPELAKRPYGPPGLTKVYGVPADQITFVPIGDGGGPQSINALLGGDVDVVNIYSTTPSISENSLVTLADPQNLIIAQNVLPLLSSRLTDPSIRPRLEAVSAKLTTADLVELNRKNRGTEKASPRDLAAAWLRDSGLAR